MFTVKEEKQVFWAWLLYTCERSQLCSSAGVHNLMPEARNEKEIVHKENIVTQLIMFASVK